MSLYPTTKLEAVNICLSNIGEAPVSSITSGLLVDAQIASDVVDESSRAVQSVGWNFNTEVFLLTPDNDGFINIPSSALRVDTVKENIGENLVVRGSRLYNKEDNTFLFTSAKRLEIVLFLEFEDLPEVARRFITLHAMRVFQERQLGVDALSAQNRDDERRAWAALLDDEAQSSDYNMLTGSSGVYNVVSRSVFRGGSY